jgi:DNA-directed RNA polymerase specialized sigma24 family protein
VLHSTLDSPPPDVDVLMQDAGHHDDAKLTPTAFSRLLEWLDDGTDSGGETYLEMRRRLVEYFDRRNRPSADALADEALDRVGRTLEKSGSIAVTPPARYCYVVARFVLLEDIRRTRRSVPFDEARGPNVNAADAGREADEASSRERRLDCLDRCLLDLRPEQRHLLVDYYRDAKRQRIDRRRDLASRLGITMNALAIRVCRMRDALESCVGTCGKKALKGFAGKGPIGQRGPLRAE